MDGLCKVPNCGRAIVVKSAQLCQQHRRQQLRGEPFGEIQRKVSTVGICTFPPCDQPRRNKGYCITHYNQQYHGRTLRMTKAPVPTTARDDGGNKWCGTCETWRPEADFASSKGKPDGLQTRCRSCNAAIYRERAEEVRDKMRLYRLNMSRQQFDAMLAEQGGACAICKSADPGASHWHVDHDHTCCPEPGRSCGRCIRGLLCSRCNSGIGYLRDDPSILRAAVNYLEDRATSVRGVA